MTMLLADLAALPPEPLPCVSAEVARSWFVDPDELVIDPPGFARAYALWKAEHAGDPAKDDQPPWARREARIALCDKLARWPAEGPPLRYTTVWRERQGGRRYFLRVEGALEVELFGRWPADKHRGAEALYLQQIPKKVRRLGIRARDGRHFIQLDINRAFLQFLARWSGDEALLADLSSTDFHAAVAQVLGITRPAAKVLNNSLVGLGARPKRQSHDRLGRRGINHPSQLGDIVDRLRPSQEEGQRSLRRTPMDLRDVGGDTV
jgi:hypothetical protein